MPPEIVPEEILEVRTINGDLFVEDHSLKDSVKGLHLSSPFLMLFLLLAEMRRRGASSSDVLKESGILQLHSSFYRIADSISSLVTASSNLFIVCLVKGYMPQVLEDHILKTKWRSNSPHF